MWSEARQEMGLQEPVHICVDQGSHSDWEKFSSRGKSHRILEN